MYHKVHLRNRFHPNQELREGFLVAADSFVEIRAGFVFQGVLDCFLD